MKKYYVGDSETEAILCRVGLFGWGVFSPNSDMSYLMPYRCKFFRLRSRAEKWADYLNLLHNTTSFTVIEVVG